MENGKITVAQDYQKKISVGDMVVNKTAIYGIKFGQEGRVLTIDKPHTNHLTTNIFGIDFDGDGEIDAQMKIEDIELVDYDILVHEFVN